MRIREKNNSMVHFEPPKNREKKFKSCFLLQHEQQKVVVFARNKFFEYEAMAKSENCTWEIT